MWILPEQTNGFFTDAQLEQVTVLFNALLPGDAAQQIPNAQQAGAVQFVHLLLARDATVYEEIPVWAALYAKALPALDAQAQQLFGHSLQQLTPAESTQLISLLEAKKLTNFQYDNAGIDQGFLFDTLRRHCIQGCFSDPRWGGNKDRIMWKWYGYQEETKEVNV